VVFAAGGLLLQGCATTSPPVAPPFESPGLPSPEPVHAPLPTPPLAGEAGSEGNEIAMRALALLGSPYKYGGSGPAAFDCSGLVQFVHEEIGVAVPRTAADQYKAAVPVKLDELRPGDLLFFRIGGKRISHVAIYTGAGRFIHAPQSGRPVELRTLDDGYYRPRLAGAGRLLPGQ